MFEKPHQITSHYLWLPHRSINERRQISVSDGLTDYFHIQASYQGGFLERERLVIPRNHFVSSVDQWGFMHFGQTHLNALFGGFRKS
ncbi:hypothetical protein RRSWK_06952 [Rhodopirellula sp. SWK7]|nr:hypothetical protein RRSWK_06952 [Rhodopirellula sp. SWK7]